MTVRAHILGVAQDGGVPHAGCSCPRCTLAMLRPSRSHQVTCLGLADTADGSHWVLDATPNFPLQWAVLRTLAPATRLGGIILTHAHMGHYVGLLHLGREGAARLDVPTLATSRMQTFLESNAPWSDLVAGRHLSFREVRPGRTTELSAKLRVTPVPVPHRAEHSDVMAFLVHGPERTLFYCPDIDSWDAWDHDLRQFLVTERVDVALLDGTFHDSYELDDRDMSQVPHPLATDTAARLDGLPIDARLVHLNHSNPLLDDGPARRSLARRGVRVAETGDSWQLG